MLLSWFPLGGQDISISAQDEVVSEVLLEMSRVYDFQLSFNDELLSGYRVTLEGSFPDPMSAIRATLGAATGIPTGTATDAPLLDCELIGKVYTIYTLRETPPSPPVPRKWRLSGRISDAYSGEALPHAHMLINQAGTVSDFKGWFSHTSSSDSIFQVQVSYLGYYILDTLLAAGSGSALPLVPASIGLSEVIVEGRLVERSGELGETAGTLNLNHRVAYRLPGNGDNSVFNMLRLQPGIMAAGERSTDLIIWGSYTGQSMMLFDGFTIYGLKNFNDNMSFVNPYMAKDIRVLKGGFGAEYGERVGGIVDITGIQGSTEKPSINLNINNLTVNGMASVPLGNRSALTLAYRHTYYNLYDQDDLNFIGRGQNAGKQADIYIYPDYVFRDFNLKYNARTARGDEFFVSLYQGRDNFSYELDQERQDHLIEEEEEEENRLIGGTIFFGKNWKNGINSHVSGSFSRLDRTIYQMQEVTNTRFDSLIADSENLFTNQIQEYSFKNKNYWALSETHQFLAGWGYIYQEINFKEGLVPELGSDFGEQGHRLHFFLQDEIRVANRFRMTPGLRADLPFHLGRIYLQPRLQLSLDLNQYWRINASGGIYNQFISDARMIDELGNYRNFWVLCEDDAFPVLHSLHLVGGIRYSVPGLTLQAEPFYKTTDGITRFVILRQQPGQRINLQGEARSYGIDFLAKKYLRRHEAWLSYTLSRTEELLETRQLSEFRDAPQDQRHEVKGAILLNFEPFFFSMNYVYGSGARQSVAPLDPDAERYPYKRLDVSLVYEYSRKGYRVQAGVSVLNLLNYENIKYSNLVQVPSSQSSTITIHAEAVPFTPTLYLNLAF